MTDPWITSRVSAHLMGEDLLKDSEIETTKHVVTLEGTVTRRADRSMAADIATRTEGVGRVLNRLTVRSKWKN